MDTTSFDAAGNAVFAFSQRLAYAGRYAPQPTWYQSMTASYYDAEGRLRVVDRRTCAWVTHPDTSVTCEAANDGEVAAFEEMRYDPLGRRIVVKTDQGWACASNCVNGITRTVWDGDRVLWEIRATNAALQQDTGAVSDTVSSRGLYGRVGYVFGAALDHPLELRRYEHGDTLFVTHATSGQTSGLSIDPVIVFPHANWRGDYTVGTYEGGRTSLCVSYPNNPVDQTPVGEDPGLTEPLPGDSSRYCLAGVQWPAAHLWLDHGLRDARPKATPGFWAGSLIHNKRDLSGNLYMRNRFYDPSSGRFTQEDPIGIAGGLNTYGFANGDPATYSDPYGLKAEQCPPCRGNENTPEAIEREVQMVESRSGSDVLLEGTTVLAAVGVALVPQAGAAILVRLGLMGRRAVPVAGAAAGAGATANRAAGRVPWDGFQAWGREVVQWGRGAPDALRRASEMTAEQAARIDPRKVDMARQFYENAVSSGRGGEAAPARVELMKRIAELQQR